MSGVYTQLFDKVRYSSLILNAKTMFFRMILDSPQAIQAIDPSIQAPYFDPKSNTRAADTRVIRWNEKVSEANDLSDLPQLGHKKEAVSQDRALGAALPAKREGSTTVQSHFAILPLIHGHKKVKDANGKVKQVQQAYGIPVTAMRL